MHEGPRQAADSGYALFSAVWCLGILLVLASSLIAITGASLVRSRSSTGLSMARAYGDAIILQTAQALQDRRLNLRPRVDGVVSQVDVLGHQQEIVVQSEFGKIDINVAPETVLQALFRSAGVDSIEADLAAHRVAAWRLAASQEHGDDDDHHIFRRTNELQQVAGLDEAHYKFIAPALTVHSGHLDFDLNTAPFEALLALPGMTRDRAMELVRERLGDNGDQAALASVSQGRVQAGVDQRGWPYHIECWFQQGGNMFHLTAIILITEQLPKGYMILDTEVSFASNSSSET